MKDDLQTRTTSSSRPGQRGSGTVIAALSLTGMLLATALAVDVSRWYLAATELQNAADAAALAGASGLSSTAPDNGVSLAVSRAVAAMNNYDFNSTSVSISDENVRFAINLSEFDDGATPVDERGMSAEDAAASETPPRFMQVALPAHAVGASFARLVLEGDSVNLRRRAVAGKSAPLNRLCNVASLSVVQDDVGGAPLNLSMEPGDPNYDTCTSAENITRFTSGCTYVIRLPPGGSVEAGNFLVLAFGDDRGGSDVRDRLARGSESCYEVGDEITTEPGVSAGPVRQGIDARFDDYGGGLSPDDYPPDINIQTGITYEQYLSGLTDYYASGAVNSHMTLANLDHNPVSNRRVMLVPVVNLSEYDPGRNEVTVSRFAAFFLQNKVANGSGGEITAEYLSNDFIVGSGSGTPGAGGDPSLTAAVLYR